MGGGAGDKGPCLGLAAHVQRGTRAGCPLFSRTAMTLAGACSSDGAEAPLRQVSKLRQGVRSLPPPSPVLGFALTLRGGARDTHVDHAARCAIAGGPADSEAKRACMGIAGGGAQRVPTAGRLPHAAAAAAAAPEERAAKIPCVAILRLTIGESRGSSGVFEATEHRAALARGARRTRCPRFSHLQHPHCSRLRMAERRAG